MAPSQQSTQAMSARNAPHGPPAGTRKRQQLCISTATRQAAATQRKRQRTSKKGNEGDEGPKCITLFERCNVDALMDLASRRPAATFRPSEHGPTLRRIVADVLGQITEGDMLATAFHEEERTTKLGYTGRRYSGYKRDSEDERFETLIACGINAASVGMSLFRLPGWLRDLGRSNLDKCYVLDMVNAHALILSRRHPSLVRLREYVDRREEVMASIPAPRKDAKQLFIKMIYGGHWRSWCQEHDVEPAKLPDIVEAFRLEMQEAREADARNHPELHKQLAMEDPSRAKELVQYVLNTKEERRVMDSVSDAVERLGGRVMTDEHDGLFVYAPHAASVLLGACQSAAGYPLTVQECARYSRGELLENAPARCGGEGWEVVDEDWEKNEALAREASTAPTTSQGAHDLFASLLMTEPRVSDEAPWPLADIFKLPLQDSNYLWYDVPRSTWVEGGGNGVARLKDYVTNMLQRRLQQYELGDHLEASVSARQDFGNKSFREGVESCLRSKLLVHDADFHLDPTASLRYLNFKGGHAWDIESAKIGQPRGRICSSHATRTGPSRSATTRQRRRWRRRWPSSGAARMSGVCTFPRRSQTRRQICWKRRSAISRSCSSGLTSRKIGKESCTS